MQYQVPFWGDAIAEVTLSDVADDPAGPFDVLIIPDGADIVCLPLLGAATVTLKGYKAGILAVPVRRVYSTGTTIPAGAKLYGVRAIRPQGSL